MLEGLADVVRRYVELDPHDVDGFVWSVRDDATVVDEGKMYRGLDEIRAWRPDRRSSTRTRPRSSTVRTKAPADIW